ncbi:MAG: Imm31 family immunity protein, partial [Planctomycetaceae bacterium]
MSGLWVRTRATATGRTSFCTGTSAGRSESDGEWQTAARAFQPEHCCWQWSVVRRFVSREAAKAR